MNRTEKIKRYLSHKHLGGVNNQKGCLYEDFYAVYQIVVYIVKYKSRLDSVEFQTQLENTFVDDLLIVSPARNVYHQLKNTMSLSWGNTEQMGDLAFDFFHQIDDCKKMNNNFTLKLVYSLKDSNIDKQIPEVIKGYSTVEHFDYEEDLNGLVISCLPLKKALAAIAPRVFFTDELANIALAFLGVWRSYNSKNKVSLKEIVSRIEDIKGINLRLYPDIIIGNGCKSLLYAIKGMKFHIAGRMFYWSIGGMNGSCLWTEKMEAKILRVHPTDKWELIKLLS